MIPDGLSIRPGAISKNQEADLIGLILLELEGVPRSGNTERSRIRRYGWDYSEKPKWLGPAPEELYVDGVPKTHESVTINEYPPRHGIGAHLDMGEFAAPVYVLSLGGRATMTLSSGKESVSHKLGDRSLITMDGNARWVWLHSIEADNTETRWSVVYRHRPAERLKDKG